MPVENCMIEKTEDLHLAACLLSDHGAELAKTAVEQSRKGQRALVFYILHDRERLQTLREAYFAQVLEVNISDWLKRYHGLRRILHMKRDMGLL